jgi:hypothetical protein
MNMARSRKKTPVQGITTARSEKQDKRLYNRRFRRICKQAMRINPEREVLPHLREYSDPWGMDKDGKVRFDAKRHPEWMRK